jgi:hypothetical protein
MLFPMLLVFPQSTTSLTILVVMSTLVVIMVIITVTDTTIWANGTLMETTEASEPRMRQWTDGEKTMDTRRSVR